MMAWLTGASETGPFGPSDAFCPRTEDASRNARRNTRVTCFMLSLVQTSLGSIIQVRIGAARVNSCPDTCFMDGHSGSGARHMRGACGGTRPVRMEWGTEKEVL